MASAASISQEQARVLLDWYRAMGVDLAVSDEPIAAFAQSEATPVTPRAAAPAAASAPATESTAPLGPTTVAANSLEALRDELNRFEGCPLKHRATQLVFADGNPRAQIMMVGEAPGSDEDIKGLPFVGRAGQLLDRMLAAIGLDRTKVYIANTVPWRPPGNRAPTVQEIAACEPFLTRQIELVAPKILVTLGNIPTQAIFRTATGITRMRGHWQALTIGTHSVRALATLHPAYLLRQPAQKAQAWQDMLALKAALEAL